MYNKYNNDELDYEEEITPSYKTSEFWFTLVSFIFSGLFLLGAISENDTKEELISVVTHFVESMFLIGGQATIFYKYINSRNKQKIEREKTKQKEEDNLSKELEEYVGVGKTVIKININTGTAIDFIQLPHIGPSTAKKIIKYRREHGNFENIQDLQKINGIGKSTFKDIQPYITI